MNRVRAPVFAGQFYAGQPDELRKTVASYLSAADAAVPVKPKALIAPHAGYIYSGPVAASAYACLRPWASHITRVVLLGPSHRLWFPGVALSSAQSFQTPLGLIPIDKEVSAQACQLPDVMVIDEAHAYEHSLEVQLPFLQTVLPSFSLVPLCVGEISHKGVARVMEALWGGGETLLVISSDLSHYLEYTKAVAMDARTVDAVEHLNSSLIDQEQACGYRGVGGLLDLAKRKHLKVKTVDVRNSGDTAGPRNEVVGYGAWVFSEAE